MKRVFHPGEEWLYLRMYMGPETAETWLAHTLPLLLSELEGKRLINKCFYLRYSDPSFHLRIRFKLKKAENFGTVLQECNKISKGLYQDELIWKTEIGTYEREIERFGEDWIETAEELFAIDTKFWLNILPGLWDDPDGENKRWQIALLSAHCIFNEFALPLKDRIELLGKMADTLAGEIGGGKKQRLQIDAKFRRFRPHLEKILHNKETFQLPGFSKALAGREEMIKSAPSIILDVNSWDEKLKQSRISDIIHMSLNRGLRSKHRMQEELIYTFLKQLYVSAQARNMPF